MQLPFIKHVAALTQTTLTQDELQTHFKGQVAAITGAGSGIGRALALTLAKLGCEVALADVDKINLAQTTEMLVGFGVKVTSTTLDVSDAKAIFKWADAVMDSHGKVNFVFNNAGVALYSTVEGASLDEIKWLMDINFWGVVYGTKAFLPLIKNTVLLNKQPIDDAAAFNADPNALDSAPIRPPASYEHGHIINMSSMFGLTAQPSQSAYNASKFAVRGFTESLRQELDLQQCGVSATCVHPGGIKTNIANSARGNDSISTLGMSSGDQTIKTFNKLLRFDPEQAALVILSAVASDARRCLIGTDAKVIDMVQRLFPSQYQRVIQQAIKASRMVKPKKTRA
jgi:hypothetical protein